MPANNDGEFCDECGTGPIPSWWAPHEQWNHITEHPESGYDAGRAVMLCVLCYKRLATKLADGPVLFEVVMYDRRPVLGSPGDWGWEKSSPPQDDTSYARYDATEGEQR